MNTTTRSALFSRILAGASIAALTALTASPSLSAAPAPVSLRCAGEKVEVLDGARSRTAWTNLLTIDLARKRWCEAGCQTQHPIVAVKPDFIDLIDETENGVTTSSHLNRETGGFTLLSKGRADGHEVQIGVLSYCVAR